MHSCRKVFSVNRRNEMTKQDYLIGIIFAAIVLVAAFNIDALMVL